MEKECQHELKLTGMYEPFSVACVKCGSLHFTEDDFDKQELRKQNDTDKDRKIRTDG